MSITLKSILALGLFTVIAACAQQEEPIVVEAEPEPIMEDMSMDKM